MAEVLQHGATAQFAGVPGAGARDMDRGGVSGSMIFPSPAGSSLQPAAAGVQALPMNSLRSAWTPVLADSKPTYRQAKEKSEAYTDELYSLSDWYKISVRSPTASFNPTTLTGSGQTTLT